MFPVCDSASVCASMSEIFFWPAQLRLSLFPRIFRPGLSRQADQEQLWLDMFSKTKPSVTVRAVNCYDII